MLDISTATGLEAEPVKLTQREAEVLRMVLEGQRSKDIAGLLFVSKRTVDFHLRNTYQKLGVTNRMQAFRKASELGLLPSVTATP